MPAASTDRASSAASLASLTSSCAHCSCKSATHSSQKPPPSYTTLHPQHRSCIIHHWTRIPDTGRHPSFLDVVSWVAPRGSGHRRRHRRSVVIRRLGLAVAGSAPRIIVGHAPAAAALASTARVRNSSGSGRTRPLLLSPCCCGRSCTRPPSCTSSAGGAFLSSTSNSTT